MSDLVARLRDWRSLHLTRLGGLFEEAAAEIEQLRLQLRERGDTEPMPKEKRAEVSDTLCPVVSEYTDGISASAESKPTLTDEEREAIELAVHCWTNFPEGPACVEAAVPLRKLLERLK